MQCRRAELSIGGPARAALFDEPGLQALTGVLRSSSARLRSIKGTERCERRRAAIRALQQAVERFADATAFIASASAAQFSNPQQYEGQTVSVSGEITLYHGKPLLPLGLLATPFPRSRAAGFRGCWAAPLMA